MTDKVKVLICDDNESVRVTLARALKYKKDVEVLSEVGSFEELDATMGSLEPDVILMDVNMPGLNGVDGLKDLRARGLETPVIIMSADKRNKAPAEAAGAASFFYKGSTDLAELVSDIKGAVRG